MLSPLVAFLATTEHACAVKSFWASDLPPEAAAHAGIAPTMEVGSTGNMDHVAANVIDLGGVWWIRWTDPGLWWYGWLHLEDGMSFAGTTSNVSEAPWLPAVLKSPTGLKHRWIFSNSLAGRIGMVAQAFIGAPDRPLTSTWVNSSHGKISSGDADTEWLMIKLDGDRWLRSSIFHSYGGYNLDYELTRIILADGTRHPTYFPLFVKHMGWWQARVFTEDDWCLQKCGSLISFCSLCARLCSGS